MESAVGIRTHVPTEAVAAEGGLLGHHIQAYLTPNVTEPDHSRIWCPGGLGGHPRAKGMQES